MPYLLIGAMLSYVAMAKIYTSSRINIFLASAIAVISPYVIINLSDYALALLKHESPFRTLTIMTLVKLAVQFVVATAVFYKLRDVEDTTAAWLGWVALGLVAYIYIVPTLLKVTLQI